MFYALWFTMMYVADPRSPWFFAGLTLLHLPAIMPLLILGIGLFQRPETRTRWLNAAARQALIALPFACPPQWIGGGPMTALAFLVAAACIVATVVSLAGLKYELGHLDVSPLLRSSSRLTLAAIGTSPYLIAGFLYLTFGWDGSDMFS